jgi:excisionase family DNA binding protein
MAKHGTLKVTRIERIAYSMDEGEEATGLSRATLMRLILDGKLASTMVGKRRLIPAAALERLVSEGVV